METIVKGKQKLSRQEKLRKNPVGWIFLLGIAIVFIVMSILPSLSEWQVKKEKIQMLTQQSQMLDSENKAKSKEAEAKELEFNTVAAPYLSDEKQIFPQIFDMRKITKILEIYALQLENLDSKSHDSHFELTRLGFGTPKVENAERYTTTQVSFGFSTDRENLEEFVHFLQTGKLSKRIQEGKDKNQIQLMDYKFLEDNLLPVAHIESIKSARDKTSDYLETQIQVTFFSQ